MWRVKGVGYLELLSKWFPTTAHWQVIKMQIPLTPKVEWSFGVSFLWVVVGGGRINS